MRRGHRQFSFCQVRILVWLVVLIGMTSWKTCEAAELIGVTASVDKQTAYIGDLIDYTIIITYDSTVHLTPPAAGANLGGFDVKDYEFGEEKTLADGRRRQILQFKLRTFTTGEYIIPPLPIEYNLPDSTRKYISADPIKINVKSMLAEGAEADTLKPRPPKEQATLAGSGKTIWIIMGIAAIIMAGVTIYLFRRKKKQEEGPYVDPRPPWEIAYADLALLKEQNMPGKGEVKPYYFELSEIMRRYLGKKFDFNAVDLTTSEIGYVLDEILPAEELRREIIAFLDHADLVKFAKYVPPAEQPNADWDAAYTMVTQTKDIVVSRPAPPEPEVAVIPAPASPGEDGNDGGLRYAPPELREYLASKSKEDSA